MSSADHIIERDRSISRAGHGGAGESPAGDAVFRLDFLCVLRVSGGDAHAWLQGQLTADMSEVGAATSRLAAWCSSKGRVLAIFRVLASSGGGYLVVGERWFTASQLARMRMFILRADVRIDELGNDFGVVGVAGARALPVGAHAWAGTAEVDDSFEFDKLTITRVPGRWRRFLVIGPRERIESLVPPAAASRAAHASSGAWRLEDLRAGIARITNDASDRYLPQMLNLDRLRAVSFEKGCYVGQEIVARAQHLGRVKRRMYLGRCAAEADVGDPIVDAAAHGAPKVGDVVAAESHPECGSVACVVLNAAAPRSPALRVGGLDGPEIGVSFPDYLQSPV